MSVENAIKDVTEMVTELKSSQEKLEKRYDGLLKEREETLIEKILTEVEKGQKATLDKVEALETAFNRPEVKGDVNSESEKQFSEFLKKGTLEGRECRSLNIKAMATDNDPAGGYLVRPEFSSAIVSRIFESSPLRQLSSVVSGGSDELVMLIDDQEAGARWVGQGASGGVTDTPQLGQLRIFAHKMEADPKITTEQVQDSYVNVESWLQGKVSEYFGRLEATSLISGNGVGKPKGILSYTAGTSTYARDAIEQVASGSASNVAVDGLINTQNALKEPYQSGASWLMKRSIFGAILRLKSTSNYHFLGLQPTDRGGFSMSILDKPVYFADDMPVAGSGSLSVAYGNFKQGYTVYDRVGIEVLRDPYSAKGFVTFYTTKRVGGAVTNFEAIKLMKLSDS
jgi:HK97 family phage major capsid protein